MIQLRLRVLHLSFVPRLDLALMTPERGFAAKAIAVGSVVGSVIKAPDRCRHPRRY